MFNRIIYVFACGLLGFFLLALVPQPTLEAAQLVQKIEVRHDLYVYEYRLDNGLTVVLLPDKNAPSANIYHVVQVGSLHERPGITGIAHLFEHMMFRPVKKGDKDFFEHIKSLGGSANANTRFASTYYVTTIPNKRIKEALEIEAKRFQNLKVTDALLNIERGAVRSEYSTKLDAQSGFDLWFAIYRLAYPNHPYGWMITGKREDLDKISAADCNKFFDQYYKAANTGLFISGHFKRKKILKLIEQLYGKWPSGEKPAMPKPYQHDGKYVSGKGKLSSETRNIIAGFRVPEVEGDERQIASVANYIFFNSSYNLADRRLKLRDKLVSSIGSHNFFYDRGLWKAEFELLPNVKAEDALKALLALPGDFEKLPASEFEVFLRRLQIEAAEYAQRSGALLSNLIYSWHKYGDIKYAVDHIKHPIKVSKKQISEYVNKYFQRSNMVVATPKNVEAR